MTPYLQQLEKEALEVIREVCFSNRFSDIVVFYSIGKDSSVLLHLFKKAFFPFPIPVRFMHIDTGWKFKEMYAFRDKIAKQIDLIPSFETSSSFWLDDADKSSKLIN